MPLVNCQHCNKEFKTANCRVKKGFSKYCSKECFKPHIGEKLRNRILRNCLICGIKFMSTPSRIKDGKAKHCSKKCTNLAFTNKMNERWANPKYRQRMSDVHKGQKMSLAQIEKQRERMKGNTFGFQKGFIPWNKGKGNITGYQRFKNSKGHKEWRTSVFERDNYTCQDCGIRSGNGKRVNLNADHIKPYALYPDLRLDVSNGKTLCVPCHYKTDTYGGNIHRIRKQLTTSH